MTRASRKNQSEEVEESQQDSQPEEVNQVGPDNSAGTPTEASSEDSSTDASKDAESETKDEDGSEDGEWSGNHYEPDDNYNPFEDADVPSSAVAQVIAHELRSGNGSPTLDAVKEAAQDK